jgi:hypothetical protein
MSHTTAFLGAVCDDPLYNGVILGTPWLRLSPSSPEPAVWGSVADASGMARQSSHGGGHGQARPVEPRLSIISLPPLLLAQESHRSPRTPRLGLQERPGSEMSFWIARGSRPARSVAGTEIYNAERPVTRVYHAGYSGAPRPKHTAPWD